MKILFVCTCLEPGLDGVGDYTTRLAGELGSQGHQCHLLALADSHVEKAKADSVALKSSDESIGTISTLRLPAEASWEDRIIQAKAFCDGIAPDWISWQFVLYGFDSRGLGRGLGRRLSEISRGYKNEIMFHETWIGTAQQAPLKNKIIGQVQKMAIQGIVRKMGPLVIHTHTPLYQHLLGKLGFKAIKLPLFGNIPITEHPQPDWLRQKWIEAGKEWSREDRNSWWIFLMFGSLHPEWNADDFLQRASVAAQKAGKKCALLSIGRQGVLGEHKWQQFVDNHEGQSWSFLNLGRQPEEDVSQCLLVADFGVSSAPPEYLFKSGTAVAMIEHGLPVIATRPSYNYTNCPSEILATRMQNVVTDFDLEAQGKTKIGSLLPQVASQFIGDLERAQSA